MCVTDSYRPLRVLPLDRVSEELVLVLPVSRRAGCATGCTPTAGDVTTGEDTAGEGQNVGGAATG